MAGSGQLAADSKLSGLRHASATNGVTHCTAIRYQLTAEG